MWSRLNDVPKARACIWIDLQRSLCYQLNLEFIKNEFSIPKQISKTVLSVCYEILTARAQRFQNWLRKSIKWPFLAFLFKDSSLIKVYHLGHWCSCSQIASKVPTSSYVGQCKMFRPTKPPNISQWLKTFLVSREEPRLFLNHLNNCIKFFIQDIFSIINKGFIYDQIQMF